MRVLARIQAKVRPGKADLCLASVDLPLLSAGPVTVVAVRRAPHTRTDRVGESTFLVRRSATTCLPYASHLNRCTVLTPVTTDVDALLAVAVRVYLASLVLDGRLGWGRRLRRVMALRAEPGSGNGSIEKPVSNLLQGHSSVCCHTLFSIPVRCWGTLVAGVRVSLRGASKRLRTTSRSPKRGGRGAGLVTFAGMTGSRWKALVQFLLLQVALSQYPLF
jgi:hypothetical protein